MLLAYESLNSTSCFLSSQHLSRWEHMMCHDPRSTFLKTSNKGNNHMWFWSNLLPKIFIIVVFLYFKHSIDAHFESDLRTYLNLCIQHDCNICSFSCCDSLMDQVKTEWVKFWKNSYATDSVPSHMNMFRIVQHIQRNRQQWVGSMTELKGDLFFWLRTVHAIQAFIFHLLMPWSFMVVIGTH